MGERTCNNMSERPPQRPTTGNNAEGGSKRLKTSAMRNQSQSQVSALQAELKQSQSEVSALQAKLEQDLSTQLASANDTISSLETQVEEQLRTLSKIEECLKCSVLLNTLPLDPMMSYCCGNFLQAIEIEGLLKASSNCPICNKPLMPQVGFYQTNLGIQSIVDVLYDSYSLEKKLVVLMEWSAHGKSKHFKRDVIAKKLQEMTKTKPSTNSRLLASASIDYKALAKVVNML